MATFPWLEDAYNAVNRWNVSSEQQNPDRGTMKDAFQLGTASKYVDYTLQSGMMDKAGDVEAKLMSVNADLDLRNTSELMGKQHGYNTQSMITSNELSKDFLREKTSADRSILRTQGEEERLSIGKTGEEQRAGMRVGGEEERKGMRVSGEEQRALADTQGGWSLRQIAASGDEGRRTIQTQGQESRLIIEKEGEVGRQNLAFDREHAYGLARRGARR